MILEIDMKLIRIVSIILPLVQALDINETKPLSLAELDQITSRCGDIELRELDIRTIHYHYKMKNLTPTLLTQCYLNRINKLKDLNAIIEINPDAIFIASSLEKIPQKDWPPLFGIPMLIKDNIATLDKMETTAGSLSMLGVKPKKEATVIRLLREAGVIILGKSNLSEFAGIRTTEVRGWSSRGNQTLNPFILNQSPNGSSSGSAVAVSANLCVASLGTETDGSVVNPASVTSVIGMKLSKDTTPLDGIIPLAPTQDSLGIFTRTTRDNLIIQKIIRDNPRLSYQNTSLEFRENVYDESLLPLDKNYRVGIIRNACYWDEAEQETATLNATLNRLRVNLIEGLNINISGINVNDELKLVLIEFNHYLKEYLSQTTFNQTSNCCRSLKDINEYNRKYNSLDTKKFGENYLELAEYSPSIFSLEYIFLKETYRSSATFALTELLATHNLTALVIPSTRYITTISPSSFNGDPIMSIPAGFTKSGLPIGLSLLGRKNSEEFLYQLAYAIEANGPPLRQMPKFLPTEQTYNN